MDDDTRDATVSPHAPTRERPPAPETGATAAPGPAAGVTGAAAPAAGVTGAAAPAAGGPEVPPVTGDAAVDAAMVEATAATDQPLEAQLAAYERAHRTLQDRLADVEG